MSRIRSLRSEAGYSALEMLTVVAIFGVVSAISAFQLGESQLSMKGDGAMRVLIAQLSTAREQAITQRRNMQVRCTNTNEIQVIRENWPGPSTTNISDVVMEGGAIFSVLSSIPDTPDSFGNGSAVNFGAAATIRFGSDGMLIDPAGNPINGSIFLSIRGEPRSARAVTIMGATGRIRGYRWDGQHWKMV
jgi:prepilin-type N-terminal cleavage/methylation domain-containing protein